MEAYVVKRDGDSDLRFTGELIASTSNSWDRAASDFSGSTGRRTKLRLYKTKGGKFICQRIGETQWQGEVDRFEAIVTDALPVVISFFGHTRLAKHLYDEAGIDAAQEVE